MQDREIRQRLRERHWSASDANDFETEHQIYREDAVLEYPQSGERTAAEEHRGVSHRAAKPATLLSAADHRGRRPLGH